MAYRDSSNVKGKVRLDNRYFPERHVGSDTTGSGGEDEAEFTDSGLTDNEADDGSDDSDDL